MIMSSNKIRLGVEEDAHIKHYPKKSVKKSCKLVEKNVYLQ